MSSTEPLFTYTELRRFIAQHLGNAPAKSTLSGWMGAVLDLPDADPQHPRSYTLTEAMALVVWGRAGELARRGNRCSRAERRNQYFIEAYQKWQSKQQNKSRTVQPAPIKGLAA